MARNSQTARTQPNQEPSPTPSPRPQADPVSLVGPPARVPQPAPFEGMVVGHVEPKPKAPRAPEPVATYGDDGSITIR